MSTAVTPDPPWDSPAGAAYVMHHHDRYWYSFAHALEFAVVTGLIHRHKQQVYAARRDGDEHTYWRTRRIPLVDHHPRPELAPVLSVVRDTPPCEHRNGAWICYREQHADGRHFFKKAVA